MKTAIRTGMFLTTSMYALIGTTVAGEDQSLQTGWQLAQNDVEMSPISGPIEKPRRHFRLRQPADLSSTESERIYRLIRPALALSFDVSQYSSVEHYQLWTKANTAPYLSSTHGNHYVNNYVNDIGRSYIRFEEAGVLPTGTVLAKDSFSVTETAEILLGPLFVMEKMPAGFNKITDDWKYSQIQPDSSLLGETNGVNSERVEYCIACHYARKDFDHLYFLPKEYRQP